MKVEDIFKIAQGLNCDYESGIWIEVKDFLKEREEIIEYKFLFEKETKLWNITIKLKDYNLQEVKDVFASFVRSIEYSYLTLYIRTDYENYFEYILLT